METKDLPLPTEDTPLSPELQTKVQTIRAFAQVHNCLAAGHFPQGYFEAVSHCLLFIREVHANAVEQAAKDKGAWRVPELKEHLDKLEANEKAAAKAAKEKKDA